MHPNHFIRFFKEKTGETPAKYIKARRMETAKRYLEETELSVKEIMLAIGENDPYIREQVAGQLSYMGVDFDVDANKNFKRGQICEISKPDSKVKVLVIPTNEELVIARETVELL